MSELMVYPQKIKNEAKDYEKLYKKLMECGEDVNDIKGKLDNSGSFSSVSSLLGKVYDNIITQATSMNNMHKALEMIAQEYISCESRICDKDADKRNLLQKIMAVFGVGDDRYQDPKYYDTTEEQEEAQDEYMKQQIQDLLSRPEYSEEAWNNATTEERKDMLQNFMNEVKSIYGVDVDANINFTNTGPENGSINLGSYRDSNQTVNINVYFMENYPNSYDLMGTIAHELRHAYQHQAIENPEKFVVTQETIDIWESNFDNYVSPGADFDLYQEQAVEVDAREFE